jgi:hypothetical protein
MISHSNVDRRRKENRVCEQLKVRKRGKGKNKTGNSSLIYTFSEPFSGSLAMLDSVM